MRGLNFLTMLIGLMAASFLFRGAQAVEQPNAVNVISQMRSALEPSDTIFRKVIIRTRENNIELKHYAAFELRKKVTDENRLVMVITAPAKLKGTCFLFAEDKIHAAVTAWVYSPATGRVNKIENVMIDEAFLNSEFSYSDMLLFNRRGQNKLLTDHEDKNTNTLIVETIPEGSWYYSKMVTVVNEKNNLPLKRYYYVKSGDLWKIMKVTDVSFSNGRLDRFKMIMKGQREKKSSTYAVESSDYSKTIPDDYFRPEFLPKVMQLLPK